MWKSENKQIEKEDCKYLSASDIVNGAPNFYNIKEIEMESAFNEIMRDIDNKHD